MSKISKSVYFYTKTSHRGRQKDTYCKGSELIDTISNEKNTESKSSHTGVKTDTLFSRILLWGVRNIPLINMRKITVPTPVDTIYTWGDIPLFTKDHIIELDNPYILTFYNRFAFTLYRPIIRRLLLRKRCKKIVCISRACQDILRHELGEDVYKKSVVLYPYTEKQTNKNGDSNTIDFVFVGLRLEGKGCLELLEAFHSIDDPRARLHVIGFSDIILESQYEMDTRIFFYGKRERKEVLEELLPLFDIFVFPTYYESLGMVALEALSCGLGLITTDVVALPEFVEDGKNGKLLKHPLIAAIDFGRGKFVNVLDFMNDDFRNKYIHKGYKNDAFTKSIQAALIDGIANVESWKKETEKLYNERFSESVWKKNFISLFD